jgi:hypothetical protein
MYVYDERTGRPWQNPPKSGRLIPRPQGTCPPAGSRESAARGTPENPTGLNVANQAAWRFDRECRATEISPTTRSCASNAPSSAMSKKFERREWSEFRHRILTLLRNHQQ